MDKIKALLATTHGKIMMGVGIVIILIVVFAGKRKNVASSPVDTGGGGGGYSSGGGGSSGGSSENGISATDLNEALTELSEQNLGMVEGLQSDFEARTNLLQTTFSTTLENQQEENAKQSSLLLNVFAQSEQKREKAEQALNERIGKSEAFNTGITGKLSQEMHDTVSQMVSQYADKAKSNTGYQSPIYEEVTPVVVDNSNRINYNVSNPYESAGQTARETEQPKFGYGGIDYNTATTEQKKQIEQNEDRIKNDSSYVESELQRAKRVQQERGMAGLDTKAQDDYIKKLMNAG